MRCETTEKRKGALVRHLLSITKEVCKHLLHLLRFCNQFNINHLRAEQMGADGSRCLVKALYGLLRSTGGEVMQSERRFRAKSQEIELIRQFSIKKWGKNLQVAGKIPTFAPAYKERAGRHGSVGRATHS